MHIAVFRSDNIGDLIHTLPLIGSLRSSVHSCRITFIGRNYVEELVHASTQIDRFISLEFLETLSESALTVFFKEQKINSLLMLKRHSSVLRSARKAKIPHIVYQIKNYFFFVKFSNFFKCKIINANFRQGPTKLHYSERCLKFLDAYNFEYRPKHDDLEGFIRLKISFSSKIENLLSRGPNLLVHCGTNGHTQEWPLDRFRELVKRLPRESTVFFTGSQSERDKFKAILTDKDETIDLFGKLTLSELAYLLSRVDCVLANATGPLHLAAALGTYTVGIYPAQPTIDAVRWRPLGKSVAIVSAPPCKLSRRNIACNCMSKINVEDVLAKVLQAPIFLRSSFS